MRVRSLYQCIFGTFHKESKSLCCVNIELTFTVIVCKILKNKQVLL
jgi:hypothetical protein